MRRVVAHRCHLHVDAAALSVTRRQANDPPENPTVPRYRRDERSALGPMKVAILQRLFPLRITLEGGTHFGLAGWNFRGRRLMGQMTGPNDSRPQSSVCRYLACIDLLNRCRAFAQGDAVGLPYFLPSRRNSCAESVWIGMERKARTAMPRTTRSHHRERQCNKSI